MAKAFARFAAVCAVFAIFVIPVVTSIVFWGASSLLGAHAHQKIRDRPNTASESIRITEKGG